MEDFFRSTYVALLKYSENKEKIIKNVKLSPFDLIDISNGIKNHFQHISGLTMEGQPQEVIGYIDSISKGFGLKERIKYSGNDLVDVIINRYAAYCKENGLISKSISCHCKPSNSPLRTPVVVIRINIRLKSMEHF